jgi:hypothetical protein
MRSKQRASFPSLEVVKLGRTEWRISDAAEPMRLLGFIERQRAGRFEVVWMSDPMRWGYADSFDAALLAFGDSARFTGEIAANRTLDADRDRASALFGSRRRIAAVHRATWIKRTGRSSIA